MSEAEKKTEGTEEPVAETPAVEKEEAKKAEGGEESKSIFGGAPVTFGGSSAFGSGSSAFGGGGSSAFGGGAFSSGGSFGGAAGGAAASDGAAADDGNDSEEEVEDEPHTIPGEENEDEVFKMRAKLYRFADTDEGKQWKDRGQGDARILKHRENGKHRLVMRREKTLKVCANHYILPTMKLKANVGSDRSWVYSSPADMADGEPKTEIFAIRFANADMARSFKEAFEKAQASGGEGEAE